MKQVAVRFPLRNFQPCDFHRSKLC
jgi:hypothetical protein